MKTLLRGFATLILSLVVQSISAQWTTPAIDAANDGTSNYPNNYNSGGTNWAVTWNNNDLFVCINNANQSEPVSIYLDVDPIVPVNGGSDANGTLVGLNYDGYSNRPNLPFRADICIYAHNGYRELFRRNGANGWTSLGGGADGICGGGTNDYGGNANGQYSSNDNGNGNGGDDRREFRISWARLLGTINAGLLPTAFNWMGYISYNNGMYAQVPVENYNGNNVSGNSNGIVRYFTVSSTGNGTSTNPFSRNSYTQPLTSSNASFGGISVFDFTMNSAGQTITRTAGGGQAWNISGSLVIAAGTVDGASSSTAININNLDLRGGTLSLSSSIGGDLNVSGNFNKTGGTFNCNSRQVNFNGTVAQSYATDVTQNINFLLISNTSANVTSSSSINVTNNLTINAGVNCRLDMGANTLNLTGSSGNTINGNLRIGGSSGSILGATALNTTFSATGTYEHNYTTIAGTIPTATWNAASNCNIFGYTTSTSATGGLSQTFGNFTWNCPNQTGVINLFGGFNGATIAGNLNIISTGSGSLRLTGGASFTLNITGNLNLSGGAVGLTNTITPNAPAITLNIGGTFNITNGTFNFHAVVPSSTGGSPIFNVAASAFTMSGGTLVVYNTTTGIGSTATINISGNFLQSAGTINNCAVGAADGTITTWNIAGNFSQTGGTLTGASLGVNPEIYINVNGNFNQNAGAIITAGAAFPKLQIEFRGTAVQNVSIAGSTLLNLWWRLNNAAGINLSTTLTINSVGKFIRNNGTITGTGGIAYVAGSQLRYTGSTNMTSTDKEWPASMSGVSVEIDNVGSVNLHASRNVSGAGGEIRLTNGSLFLGNNDLLIDYVNSGNYVIISPNSSNMFVTNGTGQLRISTYVRTGTPVGFDNYVFPIGENTGTTEYSPLQVRFYKNTVSRIVGIRVVDAINPNINTPFTATDYISRYWLVTENNAGGLYRDSITVFYTPADVVGTESNLKFSTYNTGIWTEHGTTVNTGPSLIGYQPSTAAFNQTYLPLNGLEITGRKAPVTIDYTWNGSVSSAWGTASNWTPNGIPGAIDNVTINIPGTNLLNIDASRTISNFTLSGTGSFTASATGSLTITGNISSSTSATITLNCASSIVISSASSQTIPAWNYGNLDLSGGPRILASSGTIGICGNYTPTAGATTTTGSTVNFNGTAAQSILTNAATFRNLTVSNASANVTPSVAVTVTSLLTINSNARLDMGVNTLNITGATSAISGFLRSAVASTTPITGASTATLTFNSGGTYECNASMSGTGLAGLGIPIATWNNGSVCAIIGLTNPTSGTWFGAGMSQTFNNFTWNCSAQSTAPNMAGATITVSRTFTMASTGTSDLKLGTSTSGTIDCGAFIQTGGIINLSNGTGNGMIIVNFNAGATGNFTQNGGTITELGSGSGLISFSSAVAQTITIANPANIANSINFRLNNTAGAVLAAGTILPINSGATLYRTAGAFSGSGSISYSASNSRLEYNGASALTVSTYEWPLVNPPSTQIAISGGADISLDASRSLNSVADYLYFSNGLLLLGNNNLLSPSTTAIGAAGGFAVSRMIVTNGTGLLQFTVSTSVPTTYLFPIGENTGTTEYTPVSLTFSANSTSRTIGFRVVDAAHPNLNSPNIPAHYLTRYWVASNSAAGSYTYSGSYTYTAADIVGTQASIQLNMYDGTNWTQAASTAAANVLTITGTVNQLALPIGSTAEFTGRVTVPLYYRTVTSGDWNNASTWEYSTDPLFVSPVGSPASVPPNHVNSVGISIRNTHTVTVSTSVIADDLIISNGGTLTVTNPGSFTLNNGSAATDLTINGTFNVNQPSTLSTGSQVLNNGTWSATSGITASGAITHSATGLFIHGIDGGTVPSATWNTGSTLRISGIVNSSSIGGMNQTFHHIDYNCTSQLITSVQLSGVINGINGNLTINSTGGSSRELRLFSNNVNSNTSLTILGNLIINSGRLAVTNSSSSGAAATVLNISGNLTIENGASLNMTGSASFTCVSSTVNLMGNLQINGSGSIINSINPTSGAIFRFNSASSLQTYTHSGSLPQLENALSVNQINWQVGNGITQPQLELNNDIVINNISVLSVNSAASINFKNFKIYHPIGGSSFTLSAAATLITANTLGINANIAQLNGSVQVTTARNFNAGANYVYNGTTNQITGTGLPLLHTGTLTINNSGASGNNVVTLSTSGSSGTNLLLQNGIFRIGNGLSYSISNFGSIAGNGGNFDSGVNGGTLILEGNATFSGNCDPYNVQTNGGANFGTGTVTIQSGGTFRINSGGFVNTNAPFYNSNSTLEYNTGGLYDRGLEWSAALGRGYPGNVLINTTILNPAKTDLSYAAVPFNTQANLAIASGGNLFMDFGGSNMTVPLIINGNLTLIGSLSGSGQIGGDIRLRGNWINNGSGNNFFPNGRAVFFDGSSPQSIGGSNSTINPFAFMFIDNLSGVTLGSSQQINSQLTLSNGRLTLGNFNLSISGLNTPITGSGSSRYIVTNGSGMLTRNFDNTSTIYPIGPDATTYSPVTMQQFGTSDNISVRVRSTPAYSFSVNDNNKMVNLEWIMNEVVAGGNNLSTNFQWPLSAEATGFVRGNGVFQGDYTGTLWQVRAGTNSGVNPYINASNVNYTGSLNNRPFVLGNINGIIGCVSTISSGAWNSSSTWLGGNIPPPSSSVCLSHSVQITGANTESLSALTMNVGGSLTIDASRSLNFEPGGVFTNNTGGLSSITGLGKLEFSGAGTIAGGNAVEVNNIDLNGSTNIATGFTVNGIITLNSGSSVSATPIYGPSSSLIYFTGGSYNVNLEWTGNSTVVGLGVPNHVHIRNNTILNMPGSNRGLAGNLNISAGTLNMGAGDLYVNGDWIRNGANGIFNPNNKAIFFNRNGSQNITVAGGGTETFNYLVIDKPSGSLKLSSTDLTNITVNGSLGNTLQIINNGSLDLNGNQLNLTNNGGNILVSGGVRTILSTLPNAQFNVLANKSVIGSSGGTLVFFPHVSVSLSAGMDFGNTLSTIEGTLQIALGGFVNNNPPTYATNSVLRYFTGNNFGRGFEWSATSGPGYPYHVTIDQNGTPTTLDLSNGGSAIRQIAGNLTLNDGGNLNMGAMVHPLVVKADVLIGGTTSGTLTLSTVSGGDISIAGNLTRNAGGTFIQNNREVTMNGNSLQLISNIAGFGYLKIDNALASVRISAITTINNRLWLNAGTFDLNGFTTTMSDASQIRRSVSSAIMSAAPTVNNGSSFDLKYDNGMTTGIEFLNCVSCIRDLEISNGTLLLNGNKTINRNLIMAGDLDIAANTFIFRGRAASAAGSGNLEIVSGARSIIGSGIFEITGLGANVPTEFTKLVTNPGSGSLNFGSNILIKIGDGRMNWGLGNPVTISGVLQVITGGTSISNSCNFGVGSVLRFANNVDYQVNSNDLTWAAGTINSGLPGIPWNVEVMDNGTDLNINDARALRNDIKIYNGSASLTLNPALTGALTVGGNWIRTGTTTAFNHNSKKVVFDKQIIGNQTISVDGGLTLETFYDVDFQPDNGDIVIMNALRVLNTLNMISGKVNLNGFELTLGQSANNGNLIGASVSNYFVSGNSNSKFTRYTTTTATTYSFPIGDATEYTPFNVTLNAGSDVTNLAQISVYVIASPHPSIGTLGPERINRYWSVEPTNFGSNYNYSVSYTYADADVIGVEPNLKAFKYSSGSWTSSIGSGYTNNMGTAVVNPGINNISWSGLTSFSDFTSIGNGTPLPISLLEFNVRPVLENVEISWTTASETNNDYFTVERSIDAINFTTVGYVKGAGNSNTILNYKLMDFDPYNGISYYRLKQTDFDGRFEYSNIKSLKFDSHVESTNWLIYPNPSNQKGIHLMAGNIKSNILIVNLTDYTGKTICCKTIIANEKSVNQFIGFENVSAGIYYLSITDDDLVKTYKVIFTGQD